MAPSYGPDLINTQPMANNSYGRRTILTALGALGLGAAGIALGLLLL